ncbi:CPBP family intramembrane metalloprotease [Actinomadura darangshiensis]|uniref:CPBP family intramembrane metalloprotease n=1 Tax=Actinomadura darangshiensis TaxID=705336 RepID=A0A4R5BTK1_9ACTN|nr:CPBP family intramembrane glutamic endopeptidase [Actinomadura darangshiensis]TDD87492.1 CPBP family intramembrane metalloprotease [Actinomadura darangshiensis]
MRLLKQLIPVMLVGLIGGQIATAVQDNEILTLVVGLVTAALTLVVYAATVRWSERREVTELARKGIAVRLGVGMVVGTALIGSVIANLAFLGDYEIDGKGSALGALGLVGFMAGAAVTEEVIFRGVLFRIIEERAGTYGSLVATAVLFGLWHMANPDATLFGAVAIAIEAGTMLAAAYALTRSLWFTIGLHFAWNFTAAGIFSTVVSGNGDTEGLLRGTTSGPDLVTGGEFGPEGSLYAIGFGLLTAVVMMALAHRKGNVIPRGRGTRVAATATLAQ